jgi:hypothetical protein
VHARAIDDAGRRLRELRREEWSDLGLAGGALVLAVVAAIRLPTVALPLFVGGLALGALGVRALWRRWDLVDRLADEPDAYAIPEVLAYALRETTMESRRRLAAFVRSHVEQARLPEVATVELAALADELEDERLDLDPAAAVACVRLLSDPVRSALLNPALQDGLRSSLWTIRAGFGEHRDGAA